MSTLVSLLLFIDIFLTTTQHNLPPKVLRIYTKCDILYICEAGNGNIDMFSELEFGANMCIHS